MRPIFIVIEGLDGSGSSTQARKLSEYLQVNLKQKVRLTSEPSSGPIGQMIRTGMSGRLRFSSDHMDFDRQMAYLFAADRHDHLNNDTDGVLKMIREGYFVISTRYYFSSFAYHCENNSDFPFIESLNSSFPKPDLTIFLDVEVSTSVSRLKKRSHLDRYENELKLEKVRKNYHTIFKDYDGNFERILGESPEDLIHEKIRSCVENISNAR